MDVVLLSTIVGSAAGVLGAALIGLQVRLQLVERQRLQQAHASAELTPAVVTGGLPVGVPLGRLPVSVRGRNVLLTELQRPLARWSRRPGGAWVLAGMGGLGKSTVAMTIAERARAKGWWVWWVTATDTASLTGGMLEVLWQLNAPESVLRPVREGAPMAAERAWRFLSDSHLAGRRWLLIFDNADVPGVLAVPGSGSPADHAGWLRPDPKGMVIVTTRITDPRAWGPKVIFRILAPLDELSAARVLTDLAPSVADPGGGQARALGSRLGGLPLALHLAGSYLASPFARWHAFDDYRRALDSIELPAALAELDDSAADARAAIQRTWELSLDALASAGCPQARPLLYLLSCYAPATAIPAILLQQEPLADLAQGENFPADTGEDHDARRRLLLQVPMQNLATTGLIDLADGPSKTDPWAVTVHPVVADVNRSRLLTAVREDLPAIGGLAVRLMRAATSGLDCARPGDWPLWTVLVPHLLAMLDWLAVKLETSALSTLIGVTNEAVNAQISAGNSAAAARLARSSVIAAERIGPEHASTFTARQLLARATGAQGLDAEAERLYRQLLADQQRVLGDQDPSTLSTRNYLATTIEYQRYADAERLHRQVLDDRQRILGPEHPDTLDSRYRLARVLNMQGRFSAAEHLHRAVLADRLRILGDEHPDTLDSRHGLASSIAGQGRLAEAEKMFAELLADKQRILGDEHPSTQTTRLRLGRVTAGQGRHRTAELLCRQALAARRQALGDEHPATLVTRNDLAWVIGLQGRHAEAERLLRAVLTDQERILGDDHPDTMLTAHNLAQAIGSQHRYEEARQLYSRVLDGRQRLLGDQHPDTATTRHGLAQTLLKQGKRTDAITFLEQVLADRALLLGPGHPDTRQVRDELARMTTARH